MQLRKLYPVFNLGGRSYMRPAFSFKPKCGVKVCFNGRPWQATMYLSLAGFLYRPLWTFQLWPPDASAPTDASRTLASAPTDASRTLAAEVGTYGRRIRTDNLA
jgi:hypothetical protein